MTNLNQIQSEVPSRITTYDEGLDHINLLLYGASGTGKTSFLGTIPDLLILSVEAGTRSIEDIRTGFKYAVETWNDLEEMYWYLNSCPVQDGGILIETKHGPFVVRNLALDTVTRLVQVCARHVVLGDLASDPTHEMPKPSGEEWGVIAHKVIQWLTALKQLPINTIWTAQERRGDPEKDSYVYLPDIPRSIRNFLCGDADIIARTYLYQSEDGTLKYVTHFGVSDIFQTKDRTSKLPGRVANAKWNPLMDRIRKDDSK